MKKRKSDNVLLYLFLLFVLALIISGLSACGKAGEVVYDLKSYSSSSAGDSSEAAGGVSGTPGKAASETVTSGAESSASAADGSDAAAESSAAASDGADVPPSGSPASAADGANASDTGGFASGADSTDASGTDGYAGETGKAGVMYIYVCGAVNSPGVYEIPEGGRVYQAIAAAGGVTPQADDRSLNQAQVLSDGQQITVFTREEAEKLGLQSGTSVSGPENSGTGGSGTYDSWSGVNASGGTDGAGIGAGGESSGTGAASSGIGTGSSAVKKVNINTASAEELMTLPGIGEARAAAIIKYREENGAFGSIEDIQNIEGIKKKAFAKIKDYIEV